MANQIYRWEVVLEEIISLIAEGTYGGQAFVIDLANGGEEIVYNPAFDLPADVETLADETVQGIIDGSITIELDN